jgi:MraZ protein
MLGKKAIITRGLDACLFLFSFREWKNLVRKISKLPLAKSDARGFARLMLTGAMEVEFDNLGRILIPDYLKEYAFLKKRVIVAGVFNRIEIWDEEKWKEYKLKAEKEAGNIAERLSEIGI